MSQSRKRKERVNLYVDGSNIYGGQWELFGPRKYLDFSLLIEGVEKIYPLNKVYFYASYSPLPKSKQKRPPAYILIERLFYRSVRKHKKVIFYKGRRSRTSGKEKGVDVHLACDIVQDVAMNKVDRVCLMSGDADLVYPLQISRKFKKKISLFTLPNRLLPDFIYSVQDCNVFYFDKKSLYKDFGFAIKLLKKVTLHKIDKKVVVKTTKNPGASTRG